MTTQVTVHNPQQAQIIEKVIINGDLAELSSAERVSYYREVCASLGLNPLTRPFEYLKLNGKLVLYARKECTDQIRNNWNVSIAITAREKIEDLYIVTARATMPDGRTDESTGVVTIAGLKADLLANACMKAECVPLDSEILTREGFKRWDQLQIGQEVLAYDAETDTTVWTPLQDVTTYDNAEIVSLHSDKGQFSVRCTPSHSWAIKAQGYRVRSSGARGARGPYNNRQDERRLLPTNLINGGHKIILSGREVATTDENSLLTPVEAALLGWAVTDGTIHRVGNSVRIGICQSTEANFPEIRSLVMAGTGTIKESVSPARQRTFPSSGRTYATKEQHWWYIPAAISRAMLDKAGFHDRCDLRRIVTRLSHSARQAMLQAFMLAEGDKRNVFSNGDRNILEAFEILCALEGVATGTLTKKDTIFTQRLKTTRHVAGSFLSTGPADPCPVWCPTTLYGTWVMRQNGRVMITGNTKSKRRATLSICGLGVLDETEVDTIAGARRVVVAATGEIIDSPPRPQLAVSNPSPESVAPVLPLKDAERQAPIPTVQPKNGNLPNPWPIIPEFKHKGELYGWAQNHLNLSQAKVNETLGIKTPMELTGDLKEAAERIREKHGVRPPMTFSDEIPVNEPPVDDF